MENRIDGDEMARKENLSESKTRQNIEGEGGMPYGRYE